MPDDPAERLRRARARAREYRRLVESLRRLEQENERRASELRDAEQKLRREQADVERLRGATLTSLLYSVLGTKTEKLDAEKREAVAAGLRRDELAREVEETALQVREERRRLDDLGDAEEGYRRALEEKEAWLAVSGSEAATRLAELTERLGDLESERKELREAAREGRQALSHVADVRDRLGKARALGVWDVVGGGAISSMMKHARLDEAREAARGAHRALRRFRCELQDVGLDHELGVQLGPFGRFLDVFLDNIVFDWSVQRKISRSLEDVEKTHLRVRSLLGELDGRLRKVDGRSSELSEERRRLVEEG